MFLRHGRKQWGRMAVLCVSFNSSRVPCKLTSSSGMPIPPWAINRSSSSSYSSSNPYSCSSAAPPASSAARMSDSETSVYPALVSVCAISLELVPAAFAGVVSDSRRVPLGRRGVVCRSSLPEPGGCTADDVTPAVWHQRRRISCRSDLTSSAGTCTGSTGATTIASFDAAPPSA